MTRWARPSQGQWRRPEEATSWSDLKSTVDNMSQLKKSFKKTKGDSTKIQVELTKINYLDDEIDISPKLSDSPNKQRLTDEPILKKKGKSKNKKVLTDNKVVISQGNENCTTINGEMIGTFTKQEADASPLDTQATLNNKMNQMEKLKKKPVKKKKKKMDKIKACVQTSLINQNETSQQINGNILSKMLKTFNFIDCENDGKIVADNPIVMTDNERKGVKKKKKKKKKSKMIVSDNPIEMKSNDCEEDISAKKKRKRSIKEEVNSPQAKSNPLPKKKKIKLTNAVSESKSKTESSNAILPNLDENEAQNSIKKEKIPVAELKNSFSKLMQRIKEKNYLSEKKGNRNNNNKFQNQFGRNNAGNVKINHNNKYKWMTKDDTEKIKAEYPGLSEKDLSTVMFKEARKKSKNTTLVCYLCQESNHIMRECPLSSKDSGPKICYHCGSTEHISNQCDKPNKDFAFANCFKCKQKGHLSSKCPEGGSIYPSGGGCFHCGSSDHFKRDCPMLNMEGEVKQEEEMVLPIMNAEDVLTIEQQPDTRKLSPTKPKKKTGHVFF